MKKIFLILIFSLSLFGKDLGTFKSNDSFRSEAKPSKYMDFGINGKLYKITEPDMYNVLVSAAKEWAEQYDQKKMEKIVRSEVDKRATFNNPNGNLCKKTFNEDWEDDYFTFKMDYYNPMGRLIYKKGDRMLAPSVPVEKHICLIDATIMPEAINQIKFFQEQTNGNCIYLVSNRNVMELWDKFPTYEIYPSSQGFLDRFNVKCVPAKIDMYKSKIKKDYYSIEMFKN